MRNDNQVTLVSAETALTAVLSGAKTFVKKHPVVTSAYFLGLFAALFGSGVTLTAHQLGSYNKIMGTINLDAEFDASRNYVDAYSVHRASQGWFWSCDGICQRNKSRMDVAKGRLDEVKAESNARQNEAKKVAGVFSEVGVQEVRDSFWGYFNRGKQFAKRQTMYDAMFSGFRAMSRDESTGEYLMKLLMQALMNFTIGLTMCFVMFVVGLYSIIRSYSPDPFTAVAFFLVALCAGFATTVSVILGIWGTAAAGVYTVAKVVETQARLEDGRRGGYGRPAYIRGGNLHRE